MSIVGIKKDGRNNLLFYQKVFINNKLVTELPPSKMNDEFVVEISSSFLAAVVTWPYSIRFELYESLAFKQNLVASISLPLPSKSAIDDSETTPLDKITFTSNKVRHVQTFC